MATMIATRIWSAASSHLEETGVVRMEVQLGQRVNVNRIELLGGNYFGHQHNLGDSLR